MSFNSLLTKSVIISRVSYNTLTRITTFSDVGSLACHIQTWNGSGSNNRKGNVEGYDYPVFMMFCNLASDVRVGDKITDGSETYSVIEVETLNYGNNAHLECLLKHINYD